MNRTLPAALASLLALSAAAALAAPPSAGDLPTGSWAGEGVFTLHKWSKPESEDAPAKPDATEQGKYPTSLTIVATELDGRPVIRLEILSERGQTKNLDGDRTHLVLVLARDESVKPQGGVTAYKVVQSGLTTDASPLKLNSNDEKFPVIWCIRSGGQTTLQIAYAHGWSDSIVFAGDTATKTGALTSDDGAVAWTETLNKR